MGGVNGFVGIYKVGEALREKGERNRGMWGCGDKTAGVGCVLRSQTSEGRSQTHWVYIRLSLSQMTTWSLSFHISISFFCFLRQLSSSRSFRTLDIQKHPTNFLRLLLCYLISYFISPSSNFA